LKLYDDNNLINNVARSSGKFLYRPQTPKSSANKPNKKKFSLFLDKNALFDEEPIEFNDLDSNMLNRSMIKFLPTDSLRLELQLERAEKKLKKVDEEIKTSELLAIEETANEEFLKKKKKQLIEEINLYKSEYRELGFVYKIADMFLDTKNKMAENINNFKDLIFSQQLFKKIFEKIPGYAEKQKLEKMNLLQKKIFREINKNTKTDPKKLEYLFLKKEEFNS
jgi:hypothetical protein